MLIKTQIFLQWGVFQKKLFFSWQRPYATTLVEVTGRAQECDVLNLFGVAPELCTDMFDLCCDHLMPTCLPM